MEIEKFNITSKSGFFKTNYFIHHDDERLCCYTKKASVFDNKYDLYDEWDAKILTIESNTWSTGYKLYTYNEGVKYFLAELKTTIKSGISLLIDSELGSFKLKKPKLFKGHFILQRDDQKEIAAISRKSSGFSYSYGAAINDVEYRELVFGTCIVIAILTTSGMV